MSDSPPWVRLLAVAATAAAMFAAVRDATSGPDAPLPAQGTAPLATPALAPPAAADDVILDPFTSTAGEVSSWRRAGWTAWCHLRVTVWEPSRPDAGRFDLSSIGPPAGDGTRWLDLRRWDRLAPVLDDRLALCVAKRFCGVVLEAPATDSAGFALTAADRGGFLRRVTALAEARGLRVRTLSPGGAGGAGTGDTSTTNGS